MVSNPKNCTIASSCDTDQENIVNLTTNSVNTTSAIEEESITEEISNF